MASVASCEALFASLVVTQFSVIKKDFKSFTLPFVLLLGSGFWRAFCSVRFRMQRYKKKSRFTSISVVFFFFS